MKNQQKLRRERPSKRVLPMLWTNALFNNLLQVTANNGVTSKRTPARGLALNRLVRLLRLNRRRSKNPIKSLPVVVRILQQGGGMKGV